MGNHEMPVGYLFDPLYLLWVFGPPVDDRLGDWIVGVVEVDATLG